MQLVEVVGRRRARARADALLEVAVVQQPEVAVVDQLVLLALAQRLDRELELLLGLVHRLVVEIGDARVDAQHGLRDAELVLARRELVVDERARQRRLALVAGRQRDLGLTGLVLRHRRQHLEGVDVRAQRLVLVDDLLEVALLERQHRARRDGLGGEVPEVVGLEQHLVAEVIAVGPDVERPSSSPYLPVPIFSTLPRAMSTIWSAGLPFSTITSPALNSRCLNLPASAVEHVHVVVGAQERDLAQLGRDDLDVRADVGERHAAVADRVAQAAVDAVRAALRLDPRQHAQQPARA